MTPTKEEIKTWLKSIEKNRQWLADQCEVDKRTVDSWFFKTSSIPAKAILIIQKLMGGEEREDGRGFQRVETITLQFSKAEWSVIQEYQKLHPDKSVQELAEELVLKMTEGLQSWLSSSETIKKLPIMASPMNYTAQIIGNIAAGALTDGDTIPQDIRIHRPLEKGEYVLRVNGKSMAPDIMDGSLIIMKRHTVPPIPKAGTIVEYYDERGVTIKKLAQHKTADGRKEYFLQSINPEFPDIEPMDGGRISAVYVETLEEWRKK